MSEQLETIKCVDWTINFPGAVGEGADGERAHLQRQADLQSFSSLVHLDSSSLVSHAAIHRLHKSYRSIILQTSPECWPLHFFFIINHWETFSGTERASVQTSLKHVSAITSVQSRFFSGICEATVSIRHISTCDLIYM